MGSNVVGQRSLRKKGADLTIVTGPVLHKFLDAALKGGEGTVDFQVKTVRLPSARARKITVEIHTAACEDGSGMLFVFTGKHGDHKITGFYNAKATSHSRQTGHITYND